MVQKLPVVYLALAVIVAELPDQTQLERLQVTWKGYFSMVVPLRIVLPMPQKPMSVLQQNFPIYSLQF